MLFNCPQFYPSLYLYSFIVEMGEMLCRSQRKTIVNKTAIVFPKEHFVSFSYSQLLLLTPSGICESTGCAFFPDPPFPLKFFLCIHYNRCIGLVWFPSFIPKKIIKQNILQKDRFWGIL